MDATYPKDPRLVAAGTKTARMRWGEFGRILRLDELDPETRGLVEAILRARRNAAERDAAGPDGE
jgi:hypothetical protein